MRFYVSGTWGLGFIWGIRASVFPKAVCIAVPNAILAFLLALFFQPSVTEVTYDMAKDALTLMAGFTGVSFWILGMRSGTAYRRWWEGGTLLQQTRGEWFNAYSSLIAFSSSDAAKRPEVEAYHHQLARLMSLLFCSALQQVSPDRDRPFEILSTEGINEESLEFLSGCTDKVEVILQWIQRSIVLKASSGALPIAPPILSRAFQEFSRGIVNLQNARKIADFPFPFPIAQISIVMLCLHWSLLPFVAAHLLQPWLAAAACFLITFFLWCMSYIAFALEAPFGSADNDLPMEQMQSDWNKSLTTLLTSVAQTPPPFDFQRERCMTMEVVMSNGANARKARMTIASSLNSKSGTGDNSRGRVPSKQSNDSKGVTPRERNKEKEATDEKAGGGATDTIEASRDNAVSASIETPKGSDNSPKESTPAAKAAEARIPVETDDALPLHRENAEARAHQHRFKEADAGRGASSSRGSAQEVPVIPATQGSIQFMASPPDTLQAGAGSLRCQEEAHGLPPG